MPFITWIYNFFYWFIKYKVDFILVICSDNVLGSFVAVKYVDRDIPTIWKYELSIKSRYFSQWSLVFSRAGFIELLMATLMYSFWRMVEERWREVCEDIASGRLSRTLRLDPHLETELNRLLTPDPARARELRGHFTRGFHGIAKRIWPNLRYKAEILQSHSRKYPNHIFASGH